MLNALFWGVLSASSLIIGFALAALFKISRRNVGRVMAFGVGVLISAISFELIEEAFHTAESGKVLALGMLVGSMTFFVGDVLIDRMGGKIKQGSGKGDKSTQSSGLAILLGTILDGIPESFVIGLTLAKGGAVSLGMVVAVFLSNLPEAISATSNLKASGWTTKRLLGLWLIVLALSVLATLAGFGFFERVSTNVYAFTLAFAGGALLTMIANSMMPEAYKDSGKVAGLLTTLGFGLAYFISSIS